LLKNTLNKKLMIVVIPLGGIGQRFKDCGYTRPKALIKIFGKPILYYLLDGLNLDTVDFVYIPYNREYSDYNFESVLKNDYPHVCFRFFKLENQTRGAAETIYLSLSHLKLENDTPVLCLDGDNFYECDVISRWGGENCVFTMHDTTSKPIYSYVKHDDCSNIHEIKEKEKISDYACTGAYGFSSVSELKKFALEVIHNDERQHSEFYMSGVIKRMLGGGTVFKNKSVDKSQFICLGTPIQLKQFYNNFPLVSSIRSTNRIQNKRVCFDLDNTLVTYPLVKGDYTTVKPIERNIRFLRYLKKLGNTIIIYTARRMRTHHGNVGKINADVGKITFDTMDRFEIPFDELYFGKPYADFYIDDLGVSPFQDLEKEMGYYDNKIEPRDFNSIDYDSIEYVTKKGVDLSGEIHYYSNIPSEIKDMFPLFLGNENSDSYKMERIKGTTVSDLYTSELLTTETLTHIMNSVARIQRVSIEDGEVDIYKNYSEKLEKRWNTYDYSKFTDSETTYKDLLDKLKSYEDSGMGKKVVVHGDPVFTNILINNHDKIKFIDMRGKVGEVLSINGDWLYDWAKVYQSLIGYDEILSCKSVSETYKTRMVECFETYFTEKYSEEDLNNLKLITKSLLFTLIPLHDDEKCQSYYDLLRKLP
jgi:capsule biosynthesis phosphatase